jgi:hypothetical protein
MNNEMSTQSLFPSNVYWIERPEYLDVAREVSYAYLAKTRKDTTSNPVYPVHMTEYMDDARLYPMIEYLCGTGWNILASQGYNMDGWTVICKEFWCQEHEKYSGHDEHVHGFGNQLTGIYCLDVPENSCQFIVHDPRPAKRQISMWAKDMNTLTEANQSVYFQMQPGMLYFTNSWLPHGFTRNANDNPFRFIHFNLGVGRNTNYQPQPEPIII